jgi:AAT family amino acid transporter/GABA permease
MGTVIAAMAVLPTTRSQFWLSVVTLAFILIGYEFRRRGRTRAERLDTVDAQAAQPTAQPAAQPAESEEAEQLVGIVTREQH